MFDTLTRANAADFRQRYNNTVGYLHQDGLPPLLVHITAVDGNQARFTDIDGRDLAVLAGHQTVKFEFIPVTRGWHNGKTRIWYTYRVPAKQYQRGIARGNTKLMYTKTRGGGLAATEPGLEQLVDFLGCEKPSCQSCLDDYQNNNRTGVALSRHFALADTSVYFFDRVVGSIKNRKQITLYDNFMRQELGDFIRRNQLALELQ